MPSRILGLNGGSTGLLTHEEAPPEAPALGEAMSHDAAAVLLEDGEIAAAAEQERFDRIKHSNRFPVDAARYCLSQGGVRLSEIDAIAYYMSRSAYEWRLSQLRLHYARIGHPPIETIPERFLASLFARALGEEVPPEKFRFVKHHVAHAMSALCCSGFSSALVLTIDGLGDRESGSVSIGEDNRLTEIVAFTEGQSLGGFYLSMIRYLGFKQFDEYKAMGLAPYGDPSVFRAAMSKIYALEADGQYRLHFNEANSLIRLIAPRGRSDPFTQAHKDLAASLQEALEKIILHVVQHHQSVTGLKRLCLAGGVAHNCTVNGKLSRMGLFDEVFVQPAAHDAGGSLGAALAVHYAEQPGAKTKLMRHAYLGRAIDDAASVERLCAAWSRFIAYRRVDDAPKAAAELLAAGKIIGWAQGRSEYGPRALGNRSILADPRPAENKEIINSMVKKREGFRPFAPAVLEEEASRYFVLSGDAPFMTFVVPVQPDKRALLGAVCHVDGTARVQTVSRATNETFWRLIREFQLRTELPVLLNTSFNNNAEPIVDTAEDALVCFLTTGLDALVIGDVLIERRPPVIDDHRTLIPRLPKHVWLTRTHRPKISDTEPEIVHELRLTTGPRAGVSESAHRILDRADGTRALGVLIDECATGDGVIDELLELWSRRLIAFSAVRGASR
jgi:carbamoyltransferase